MLECPNHTWFVFCILTSRRCLEWDWVSCIGSILIEDGHSHLVLHSRDSVHHLLSHTTLQLVLLGYCPIGEQYCECQGLRPLVCMLMCQRPCNLYLESSNVWHSHIWRKGRGDWRGGDAAWDSEWRWYRTSTIYVNTVELCTLSCM